MAFVRTTTTFYNNGAAAATIVFPAMDCAAGALLSGGVGWENGGANDPAVVTGITDTAGNTWVIENQVSTGSATEDEKGVKFHCLSSIAQLGNVITVTMDASRDSRTGFVSHYTNAGGVTLADDATGFSDTNVSTATTGSVTGSAGSLLTAYVQHNSTSSGITGAGGLTVQSGGLIGSAAYLDDESMDGGSVTPTANIITNPDSYVMLASVFTEGGSPPEEITGTGALTIPAATASGSGARGVVDTGGPVALSFPAITLSGEGNSGGPPDVSGTGALTLPLITVSGIGFLFRHITGDGALLLPAVTLSGSNIPYDPDAVFISGTAVSPEGVMQTLVLGDGVPVPGDAVFIDGIAHSPIGQRYIAPWPSSGIVGHSGGRALRVDGAQTYVTDTADVYMGGFGYSVRGELCVTTSASSNFVAGISVNDDGQTAVSQS